MSTYLKCNPSQSLRDITEDYYQELRKPKRIIFIVNGNKTFSGKLLSITPNRYFTLNDLLNDLTRYFINYIPTGIRRIHDKNGRQIMDIDDLEHRNIYVCCGQESLKFYNHDSKYFEIIEKGHFHNHNSHFKFYYNPQEYFDNSDSFTSPQTPLFYRGNRLYPISTTPNAASNNKPNLISHPDRLDDKTSKPLTRDNNNKPKILTLIRTGIKPYSFFKILLSKSSTQSYEDLLSDISDTFGSNLKGKPMRKICNIDGKEIQEISDFFQLGKYYFAFDENDPSLNREELRNIVSELFPKYEEMSDQDREYNRSIKYGKAKLNDTEMTLPLMEEDYLSNNTDKSSQRKTDFHPSISNHNDSIRPNHKSPQDAISKRKTNKRKNKQPMPSYYNDENSNPGYPKNDSRKPGPFEMTPEKSNEKVLPPKIRAQIFGLERIRAGLEERERARFLMTRKLGQENQPKLHSNKYSKVINDIRNESNPFYKKPLPNKRYFDKYKYSPYLNSLEGFRNNKENVYPFKNSNIQKSNKAPYIENHSSNQYSNSNNKQKPETDRNSKRSPRSDQISLTSRNTDNKDKRKQPWERIPPINLGRHTPRYDFPENFNQLPEIKISLPTVNEENDDKNSNTIKEKPSNPKYNISFEVNLLDTDEEKNPRSSDYPLEKAPDNANQSLKSPNIEKSSSTLKRKEKSMKPEIKKKTSLAELIGPRSQTVNLLRTGKSFQKPTRTEKQSLVIQNPLPERLVPVLAQQLVTDDDFENYYQLGTIIGTGNFSEVKQAKKKQTGKPFAAKIIDKKKLKDKEDLIEEEIRILKSCDHPNIVKLEEQFETPNKVFLIQELIKEGDLFDAICENIKFTEPQSALMMRDIFRALFYIHSRGIVHRDVKPENLLCSRKNGLINLKLSDFGLAVVIKEPLYIICGTPTYVAPEILTEQGYGIEVDIWAAGVICYILLCGYPPFRSPERNQTELFEFIKAGEFEYLKSYWDDLSEESKDLINNMLIVDPEKRFTVLDCLCHPWIITLGNSIKFSKPLNEVVTETRVELQMEAAIFKSNNNNNI